MADYPIRYEDRIFVTGTTSSGKSTLARKLYLAAPAPRLVIDPADSELTETPGCVTFSDPARATNSRGENWHEAASARFVPGDPYDLDGYSRLFDWMFDQRRPRWVWCDEAGFVFPSSGGNRGGARFIAQGRKRSLGHLACHTRPRWVSVDLIANAAHVFVFTLPAAADRQHVAENIGVPRDVLEQAHAQLKPHGYLWWRQRERHLMICDPHP